jgi:ribosome assembly protein YihI (activator of Der GTPase)
MHKPTSKVRMIPSKKGLELVQVMKTCTMRKRMRRSAKRRNKKRGPRCSSRSPKTYKGTNASDTLS